MDMRTGVPLLGAVLLIMASGCDGTPEKDATGKGTTAVGLQLNWFPEPEFGGFYEAQRAGLFREAGLEVRLLAGGPSVPAVQLVASGRAQFGIASADQVVEARAQDVPIVALFAVYQTSPQGIMVHASSGIHDLAGVFAPRTPKLTLAVQNEPYVAWLESLYDFSNVKRVSYQGGVAQFVHDENFAQQCFVTFEPFAADAAGAQSRAFLVAESGFDPYATIVITREDYLARNEAAARALIAAVREGWARYLDDPAPANAIMLPMNPGASAESFAKASQRQLELIRNGSELGTMTALRWQTLIDQMLKIGAIREPIDPAACFRTLPAQPIRGS